MVDLIWTYMNYSKLAVQTRCKWFVLR